MDTGKFFIDQIQTRFREREDRIEPGNGKHRSLPTQPAPGRPFRQDLIQLFIDQHLAAKEPLCLSELMKEIERTILIKSLAQFNGNQKDVARFLGIKYTTLHEKVKKYKIRFQKKPVLD